MALAVTLLLTGGAGCCLFDNGGRCGDVNWNAPGGQYVQSIPLPEGGKAPLYMIRFDRDGGLCSAGVRDRLLADVRGAAPGTAAGAPAGTAAPGGGRYTDVFVMSHGWNNEWSDAIAFYTSFFSQYEAMRGRLGLTNRSAYRPVFVGIDWPSAILVQNLPPPEPGRVPGMAPAGPAAPRAVNPAPPPQTGPATGPATQPATGPAIAAPVVPIEVNEQSVVALAGVFDTPVRQAEVELLATELERRGRPDDARRLRDLAKAGEAGSMTEQEASQLAQVLAPFYRTAAADEGPLGAAAASAAPAAVPGAAPGTVNAVDARPAAPATPTAAEVLNVWRASSSAARAHRTARGAALASPASVAASLVDLFRWAMRATTVWMMKDRAGVVGANGVGPLLNAIQAADPSARVHLIGHSFGAKVCLSAALVPPQAGLPQGGPAQGRPPVDSVLLLQPAMSAWCFAPRLPDPDRPGRFLDRSGAYQPALLGRVRQPILSTCTDRDWLLHFLFDKFVRRRSDVGEPPVPQAEAARPPLDPFLALGGYGPVGTGPAARDIPVKIVSCTPGPGQRYDLGGTGPIRVFGLDGSNGAITGHSDVNNPSLWWVLYNQVDQPGR